MKVPVAVFALAVLLAVAMRAQAPQLPTEISSIRHNSGESVTPYFEGWIRNANGTFDLVFSNLMLHWHPTPHSVFPEWKRVLAVDGLLLFSCFGPDTLQELRAACAEALQESYPMPFIDMHDFGDMMVAAGFATPVMDVETIRLTYPSAHELIAEARALGGNPRDDRGRSIVSGARARALLAALERRRDHAGRIPLTFEVAYGHAWKPAPKSATETVISLDRLRAGLGVRGV